MMGMNLNALDGDIVVKWSSTVEPTTGKRSRTFEHSVPARWAALIAIVVATMLGVTIPAIADPGDSRNPTATTRPDDQGDEHGQGQGQGNSQGGPNGQGRGNGVDPTIQTSVPSTTSSTSVTTSSTIGNPSTTPTPPVSSSTTVPAPTSVPPPVLPPWFEWIDPNLVPLHRILVCIA